ncbi:MAG: hypothetical protein K9J83_02985 [Desulfarculaceae bacterium]|nr:hypothetical protein [Desulfarculaceae bacterium]
MNPRPGFIADEKEFLNTRIETLIVKENFDKEQLLYDIETALKKIGDRNRQPLKGEKT